MATATHPGEQLKLIGLSRAEGTHKEALTCAQFLAELLGNKQPIVTADDVFQFMDPKALGKAAGNIFRNGSWEFVCWQDSVRESNHGRPIRGWSLRGNRS